LDLQALLNIPEIPHSADPVFFKKPNPPIISDIHLSGRLFPSNILKTLRTPVTHLGPRKFFKPLDLVPASGPPAVLSHIFQALTTISPFVKAALKPPHYHL
jgi:hypothetical protein